VEVVVRPPEEEAPCPVLAAGRTYTLVSTTGGLSGSFSDASEHGAEIPVRYSEVCKVKPSQTIRISYHESGATQTVTATVEAKRQEEEASAQQKRAERVREEEAAAARRKAEAEAAAKTSVVTQESPLGGVAISRPAPDARLYGSTLRANASGAVMVKVTCPAGATRCIGSVTLRTLLAKANFNVAGGHSETVALHLSAKARKLLARSHSLRVRAIVLAHDTAGVTHTWQATVTVRAPATSHGKG